MSENDPYADRKTGAESTANDRNRNKQNKSDMKSNPDMPAPNPQDENLGPMTTQGSNMGDRSTKDTEEDDDNDTDDNM